MPERRRTAYLPMGREAVGMTGFGIERDSAIVISPAPTIDSMPITVGMSGSSEKKTKLQRTAKIG